MTPEEEIGRAVEAQQIIDNRLYKEAFEQVSEALLSGMRSAAIVDEKLRLRLLERYELLYSLRAVLEGYMETGKLARKQLDLEEQQRTILQRIKEMV